jgi:hypothetical protein
MKPNKLTLEMIHGLIQSTDYLRFKTLTICVLTLKNGAMVTGESNVIDPANYDEKLGEDAALNNAVQKIWGLEGYAMKRDLAREAGGKGSAE